MTTRRAYKALAHMPWRWVGMLAVLWLIWIWPPRTLQALEAYLAPIAYVDTIRVQDTDRGLVLTGVLHKQQGDCRLTSFTWLPYDRNDQPLVEVTPVLLRDGQRRAGGAWPWGPWLFPDKTVEGMGRLRVLSTYTDCGGLWWLFEPIWDHPTVLLDIDFHPARPDRPMGFLTGRN